MISKVYLTYITSQHVEREGVQLDFSFSFYPSFPKKNVPKVSLSLHYVTLIYDTKRTHSAILIPPLKHVNHKPRLADLIIYIYIYPDPTDPILASISESLQFKKRMGGEIEGFFFFWNGLERGCVGVCGWGGGWFGLVWGRFWGGGWWSFFKTEEQTFCVTFSLEP